MEQKGYRYQQKSSWDAYQGGYYPERVEVNTKRKFEEVTDHQPEMNYESESSEKSKPIESEDGDSKHIKSEDIEPGDINEDSKHAESKFELKLDSLDVPILIPIPENKEDFENGQRSYESGDEDDEEEDNNQDKPIYQQNIRYTNYSNYRPISSRDLEEDRITDLESDVRLIRKQLQQRPSIFSTEHKPDRIDILEDEMDNLDDKYNPDRVNKLEDTMNELKEELNVANNNMQSIARQHDIQIEGIRTNLEARIHKMKEKFKAKQIKDYGNLVGMINESKVIIAENLELRKKLRKKEKGEVKKDKTDESNNTDNVQKRLDNIEKIIQISNPNTFNCHKCNKRVNLSEIHFINCCVQKVSCKACTKFLIKKSGACLLCPDKCTCFIHRECDEPYIGF